MKQNPQGPGYNSKVTNEENMTLPQEKIKSTKTNPNMTYILELADKDFKETIITIIVEEMG